MAIFQGAGVAITTPFKANGEVDYDTFRDQIEYQIAGGIAAICVCATTGEAPTLEDAEHQRIIGFAARKIDGRVPGEICLVSGRVFRMLRALCVELPFKLSLHDSLPALDAAFAK